MTFAIRRHGDPAPDTCSRLLSWVQFHVFLAVLPLVVVSLTRIDRPDGARIVL
jgi:hypothetical protein